MRVVVTGAGGFVGRGLVQRMLQHADALARPLSRLIAIDQRFGPECDAWRDDARVTRLEGDFAAPELLDRALAAAPDLLFHLASVPGSLAEREPGLGWQVNLMAPIALLQRLATQARDVRPRVVFASSVAVYGALPVQGRIDEDAATHPALSYGAHKRMTELLIADLSRRGEIDGVSLRLPGIVARPLSASGHGSAFMSDLIRRLSAGQPYDCPVSAAAQAWWMSLPCCIDNLLHAARMPSPRSRAERTVQLPVLCATVGEVVAAIDVASSVRYRPDETIEALFGRLPHLDTPRARALGFRDDGHLPALVRHSLG